MPHSQSPRRETLGHRPCVARIGHVTRKAPRLGLFAPRERQKDRGRLSGRHTPCIPKPQTWDFLPQARDSGHDAPIRERVAWGFGIGGRGLETGVRHRERRRWAAPPPAPHAPSPPTLQVGLQSDTNTHPSHAVGLKSDLQTERTDGPPKPLPQHRPRAGAGERRGKRHRQPADHSPTQPVAVLEALAGTAGAGGVAGGRSGLAGRVGGGLGVGVQALLQMGNPSCC